MNLPNKLTVLRIIMIPLFLGAMYWQGLPWNHLWALIVFAAASITDTLDGQIARKRGLVTDFGKFMDPLADKLLVMSAMVCFVEFGIAPAWGVVLILARELAITGLRTLAAGAGIIMAADNWGKLKTVTQMSWICVTLFTLWIVQDAGLGMSVGLANILWIISDAGFWLVVFFTILSGANYLWNNRQLFKDR